MDVLIATIVISYIGALILDRLTSKITRYIVLIITVGMLLVTLFYYKYWDFLILNFNNIFGSKIELRNIIMPIVISFFVFQAISYIVDIYRGESALRNPIDIGLYIAFFPQLIAGPIVRFHDIKEYLNKKYRLINIENIEKGLWRFSIGLCKKVLLANNLGGLSDIVFSVRDISQFSVLYTWLGAIAYTLQIYYDFSGYSDMAIGLGKIFGFDFQENFNYPYMASSIRDFWHRWHISCKRQTMRLLLK